MMNNFIQSSIYQHNWIVPRSVMCTLFWTGVILVFTGMILLVTSKHKGKMYESWGGVLLGLGLCILLICLILCIHAYCVMAASASGDVDDKDDESTEAKTKARHSGAMGDYDEPLTTATTSDIVYSNSAAQQANGRKPPRCSAAPLIPPPKFGVSVTKPATHTVRFFLSDANGATNGGGEEGEGEEKVKAGAAVLLQKEEEPGKNVFHRQMPSSNTTTTTSDGRTDVPPNGRVRSSIVAGRRPSSPVKDQRSRPSTATTAATSSPPSHHNHPSSAAPSTATAMDQQQQQPEHQRSLSDSRNPVLLSSDCDSLMSVETIVPRRTLPGSRSPEEDDEEEETGRSSAAATPYSFLDDDYNDEDAAQPPRGLDEEGEELEMDRWRRGRGVIDPTEGRLSSSSGSAKWKKVNSPSSFPGPFPSSVVARDAGGGHGESASHLPWQTHRHSYAKSKQQQHYSSDTSPSPGSPPEGPLPPPPPSQRDAPVAGPLTPGAAAAVSFPPTKSAHGPGRPLTTTPVVAPGAWSITRSFGPSSVTVTPLGTHEPPAPAPTNIKTERHAKGGGGGDDGSADRAAPHHPHQHPHQRQHHEHRHQRTESRLTREAGPGRREEAVDQYRSMKRDDPAPVGGDRWRSMERQRHQQQQQQQHQHPASTDNRYITSQPHPDPAPAALEMTESKATVYDNVQYFQM